MEAGRADSWERTGNAHTLTLSPQGATIQDEMDEDADPYVFTLPELREAVEGWLSFLDDGRA